jgi:hypothetical protein
MLPTLHDSDEHNNMFGRLPEKLDLQTRNSSEEIFADCL